MTRKNYIAMYKNFKQVYSLNILKGALGPNVQRTCSKLNKEQI